jgi:hypothetical protein
VSGEADRRQVVEILDTTYRREKQWIADPETQIPPTVLECDDIVWFVVTMAGCPAGALRVYFDVHCAQYTAYAPELLDSTMRLEDFLRHKRIAEVGRFAVKPEFRAHMLVAAALMRAATEETLVRGFTHLVTDVFEDDPHSPYSFHTGVLGFQPVATHDTGELLCRGRRITLVLDLKSAYARLNTSQNWLFRYLTSGWGAALHQRAAGEPAEIAGGIIG